MCPLRPGPSSFHLPKTTALAAWAWVRPGFITKCVAYAPHWAPPPTHSPIYLMSSYEDPVVGGPGPALERLPVRRGDGQT